MEGHASQVQPAVLAWAERKVARAMSLADAEHAIREDLDAPRALHANGQAAAFLADVLARRIERDQDLALEAMAVLGGAAAAASSGGASGPTTPIPAPRRSRRSTRWVIGASAGR